MKNNSLINLKCYQNFVELRPGELDCFDEKFTYNGNLGIWKKTQTLVYLLRGDSHIHGENKADIWEFFMKKLFIKTCGNFLCHTLDVKKSRTIYFGTK